MRRLTKAQPIGGAWLCSFISSVAYSAGSASGMVASSCATFMIGPFSPPSAAASAERIGGAVALRADEALPGHARGDAADLGCRRWHSVWRGRRSGFFRGRGGDAIVQAAASSASSSSIRLAITLKPPSQNFGSRASSPNGASSSE